MKKIISVLLALTMLPCFAAVSAKNDTTSDSAVFLKEAKTLIDLKVLCGEDVSTIKPFSKTKKYQLVNYIYSMFNDCSCRGEFSTTAAEFAQNKGIISDASDLKKSDALTIEVASKMLVDALGYGAFAQLEGGWPEGYVSYARKIDLLDGVTAERGKDMEMHDVVKMLYNAIDCSVAVPTGISEGLEYEVYKDGTILAYYRDIYKGEGQVTENYYTSLWSVGTVDKDQVVIDTDDGSDIYEVCKTNADELVGYPVKYYYRETEGASDLELMHIEKNDKKCKEIEIDVENIEKVEPDLSKITYRTSTDAKKYAKLENAKVIYNGQLYGDCEAADLTAEKGTLTLIDTDGTGSYDIIRAEIQETILVDGVNKTEKTITNKFTYPNAAATLNLNVEKTDGTYNIKSGTASLSIGNLAEWDVLTVYRTKGPQRQLITVNVSSETVTGTAMDVDYDSETIKVGEEKYAISKAYLNAKDDAFTYATIAPGKAYVFYLNADGEVVAAKIKVSSDWNVGYARRMAIDEDVETKVFIRIYNINKEWDTYELAEKVTYNGKKVKAEEIYTSEMAKGGGSFEKGLVHYQLNADNQIKKLETAIDDNSNYESERLRKKELTGEYRWNDASVSSKYYVSTATTFWLIPAEANSDNESLYNITTDRWYLEKDTNYNFELYNLDEYRFTNTVTVVKDVTSKQPNGNFFVVTDVVSEVGTDGDLKQSIVGSYQKYDKMQLTAEKFGMFDDIKPGDILTVNPNQNAVIGQLNGFAKWYDIDDGVVYYNTGELYSAFARMSGVVVKADGDKRRMMINNGNEIIIRRCVDAPNLVIYNKDTRVLERGTIGSLNAGDFIVYREFWASITDIVVIRENKD